MEFFIKRDSNGKQSLDFGKILKFGIGIPILFFTLMGSFFITSGTEYAVLKSPNGALSVVSTGGINFKVPFVSEVTRYDMVIPVTYVDDNDANNDTYGSMKRITFTDTYGGMVGGTFLYRLSPVELIKVHTTYGNQDNLIESGLTPISKQLLAYTANQFSGESFMQGGQNEYQNRVEDQANNGLIVTKRVKESVAKGISTVGVDNQNPKTRDEREEMMYITQVQTDEKGEPLRIPLALNDFGITLPQVTIDDFKPDQKLREFIERKQNQIAARQDIIEKQENARQGSILAEANGERERIEAKQNQLKDKDIAVIQADKGVALEKKEAEKQVVRVQKDLDIALMDKQIQKAKSESTIFQAQAIKAQGLAEAEVKRAMYAAVNKDILSLEVERAVQIAKYKALETAKITMPTTVMMGSGDGGSLQELTNLQIMDKLK